MNRQPLPKGYKITMGNGSTYTIKRLIGQGGFSLIYSADTVGGTSSVVVKEFFPSEGAFRGQDGLVVPKIGCEENFYRNLARFENEGAIGGKVSDVSFQAISFLKISDGYAIMKQESEDMRSIANLVEHWNEFAPLPFTGNHADRDPVFPDLVRVRYALRVIESVLSALKSVHDSGYLHLDISNSNIIWAGRDIETGENCEAFLADFGCSVEMNSGEYHPEYQLSYSPGFAAPEVQRNSIRLTPATDLYSVGILLFYLCIGANALGITHNRKRQIQRELAYLSIPERFLTDLQRILMVATDDMTNRYQSVSDMLKDIRVLRNAIPIHPFNPDNSKEFTLYSLKSMLEGSLDTHYSWADELRDRRNRSDVILLESAYLSLSGRDFKSDESFLMAVLPEEIYNYINKKLSNELTKNTTIRDILSCNYDFSWKREICNKIERYKTRRFLEISRTLLKDESAFLADQRMLFELLGKEGERLRKCFQTRDVRKTPYVGLAMMIVFALLGPEGFKLLLPSPTNMGDLFQPL